MLTAGAFAFIYLGFALLALSQQQHWTSVVAALPLPQPSAPALRRQRYLAGACLAIACAVCFADHGAGFGALMWVLLLGAGAMAVSFTLSWKPHYLRGIAKLA